MTMDIYWGLRQWCSPHWTSSQDMFVKQYLEGKVEEVAEVARKMCNLLEDDLQAKWTLLSSSITHKLDYHLSLQYPSDIPLS